jgi:endonuclease YncB( thermonuclease family)
MRLIYLLISQFFLIVVPFAFSCSSQPQLDKLTGKVVKIADGDTFTLLVSGNMQVRVRLYGIDCPENGQPFGNKAKQFTAEQIFGKQVLVEIKDKDRYGRTIGLVITEAGKNLNELLLQNGLAWHYKMHDKNPEWAAFEKEARESGIGLWSYKDSMAPWDWRKKGRK